MPIFAPDPVTNIISVASIVIGTISMIITVWVLSPSRGRREEDGDDSASTRS